MHIALNNGTSNNALNNALNNNIVELDALSSNIVALSPFTVRRP